MTNYGSKVTMKHSVHGNMIFRNVTEIHYKYMSQNKVAIESDIHSSGGTYDLCDVLEIETELETGKAKNFEDESEPPMTMAEAVKQVCEELLAMSNEEFQAIIKEDKATRCFPNSCTGSCQGMGWCYDSLSFRGELPDDEMEDLLS